MITDILLIIALFILPVLIGYFRILPFKFRFHILGLVSLAVVIIIIFEKWTLQKIGLRLDNIQESLFPYLLFTLVLSVLLVIIAKISKKKTQLNWWGNPYFIYGFIAVSLLQEFLFRGFLIPKLESFITVGLLVIILNAILFTFMHIIYSNNLISLGMIFLGGIGFASMYIYFPNLILITISHSILNFIAVLFGFYTYVKTREKEWATD